MLSSSQGELLPGELSTAVRLLTLLSLVPAEPHRINTATLEQELYELGYLVSARTVQRDLKKLQEATVFGLECDTRTRPYRWFIGDQQAHFQRPKLRAPLNSSVPALDRQRAPDHEAGLPL